MMVDDGNDDDASDDSDTDGDDDDDTDGIDDVENTEQNVDTRR